MNCSAVSAPPREIRLESVPKKVLRSYPELSSGGLPVTIVEQKVPFALLQLAAARLFSTTARHGRLASIDKFKGVPVARSRLGF